MTLNGLRSVIRLNRVYLLNRVSVAAVSLLITLSCGFTPRGL